MDKENPKLGKTKRSEKRVVRIGYSPPRASVCIMLFRKEFGHVNPIKGSRMNIRIDKDVPTEQVFEVIEAALQKKYSVNNQ